MLLPRLQPPLRAAIASINRSSSSATLLDAFAQLSLCSGSRSRNLGGIREASHKAQGAVNKAKDGPGKRLGAKKSGEQYVIPGNIIFRQRGTHWFPGDNCAMGRDHTIYAVQPGFVKYYKDPERHPRRQYIGVVFQRDQILPLPRNAPRRRRLGMVASKMEVATDPEENNTLTAIPSFEADSPGGEGGDEVMDVLPAAVRMLQVKKERRGEEGRDLKLRDGYMYRESNWEIGRAAERAGVKVKPFKPGDRWKAWRKSKRRREKNAERKGLSRGAGGGGKKKKR